MDSNQDIIRTLCRKIIREAHKESIGAIAFVKIDFTQRPVSWQVQSFSVKCVADLIESTEANAVEDKDFQMLESFSKMHTKSLVEPYSKQMFLSYHHRFSSGIKVFHTTDLEELFDIINKSIGLEIQVQEILESAVTAKAGSN